MPRKGPELILRGPSTIGRLRLTAYIFDLDGTIANNEHRLHLIKDENWEQYFELSSKDTPYEYIVELMDVLHDVCQGLFICTSRDESQRLITEDWLDQHEVRYDHLMMAQIGDTRSHAEIKKGMVDFIRADGYEILLAVDDRPSVIKMFRDNGIPCLAMSDHAWQLEWNKDE
jgi:uncharacterized HAD superfamily protein